MTTPEPAPRRTRRTALIIAAVVVALGLGAALAVVAVTEQRAREVAAAASAERAAAEAGCRSGLSAYVASYGADLEIDEAMTVRSLTEFAESDDAVEFSEDGMSVSSIDVGSAAAVDRLVLEYTQREERQAADGIHSLAVSGEVVLNGEPTVASCIVGFKDGEIEGTPSLWINIF